MRRATDSTENVVRLCEISIHALHEESDTEVAMGPATAATISIHALHEESDRPAARRVGDRKNVVPGKRVGLRGRRITKKKNSR